MAAALEVVNVSLAARQYAAAGWALVPIDNGTKGPTTNGWNRREHCVTTAAGCVRIRANVGLAHAYSGTCVIDLDDIDLARKWLASKGIVLANLWDAPDAVRISSGRPNRGKLLFKLPAGVKPLVTRMLPEHGLELRCATSNGRTMQDVLPPSVHPDTGRPYVWEYDSDWTDWSTPPELPAAILAVWQALFAKGLDGDGGSYVGNGDEEAARAVLADFDPDEPYPNWVEIGMALHHEFDGAYAGLGIWDEWSAKGSKYEGLDDLEKHWRTFDAERAGAKATLEGLQARVRQRPISPGLFEVLTLPQEPGGDAPEPSEEDNFEDLTEGEDPPPPVKKPAGFVFQTVAEFLNRAPPSWIIKGLLPRAALGIVYGDSGAGKTFVALDQAMAVALGREWRGAKTKQGRVAYIVAEGATGFQDRVLAYCRQHDVDPTAVPIHVLAAAPDMMDAKKDSPGGVVALGKALRKLGPLSVIYVDTYARVMGAGNENEAKDTNTVVANCYLLHQVTGAIVILIHHSGKDSTKGARGSGALRAAADVEYSVIKAAARRTVKVTKMKDGEDGREYHFKLHNVTVGFDEDGEDRTSCVLEHLEDGPSVAEQLAAQPVKASGPVQARIMAQLATYPSGEVEREQFIEDVRAITPLPPSGVESASWKALITRPLDKMISDGVINQVSGRLYIRKDASK